MKNNLFLVLICNLTRTLRSKPDHQYYSATASDLRLECHLRGQHQSPQSNTKAHPGLSQCNGSAKATPLILSNTIDVVQTKIPIIFVLRSSHLTYIRDTDVT